MDYIYIVRTINLTQKTESDLHKEYEIAKIKYPKTYKNYKQYLEDFLISWNNDKYSMLYEDNSCFNDYELAESNVINNIYDINDGGVYNYVAIIKIPVNGLYSICEISEEDIILFKFNQDTDTYYKINYGYNEETRLIIDKMIGRVN